MSDNPPDAGPLQPTLTGQDETFTPWTDHNNVRQMMRGMSQRDMIRHRDDGPREMAQFAEFANDPDVTRREVAEYVVNLAAQGVLSAPEAHSLMVSIPHNALAIRQWAIGMFSHLAHAAVHAHAAYPADEFPGQPQAAAGAAPQGAPGTPPEEPG